MGQFRRSRGAAVGSAMWCCVSGAIPVLHSIQVMLTQRKRRDEKAEGARKMTVPFCRLGPTEFSHRPFGSAAIGWVSQEAGPKNGGGGVVHLNFPRLGGSSHCRPAASDATGCRDGVTRAHARNWSTAGSAGMQILRDRECRGALASDLPSHPSQGGIDSPEQIGNSNSGGTRRRRQNCGVALQV